MLLTPLAIKDTRYVEIPFFHLGELYFCLMFIAYGFV